MSSVETVPAESAVAEPTAALPVRLCLSEATQDDIRAWIEGVLGWQAVEAEADVLVPPRLCLTDPLATGGAGPGTAYADIPTVLLVGDDHHPADVATAAMRIRPVATLRWPQDRDRLEDAARGGLSAPRSVSVGPRTVRVGGSAGGVGTSTVAAALGGLFGWQGESTLLVVGPGAPVADVRALATESLAGPGLWSQASPLPGVRRIRAVRTRGDGPTTSVTDPAVGVCVVDVGVGDDVDVLVCRPDTAGLAAARRTTAAAVVVIGSGPAPHAAVHDACGPRRRVHLPRSARVARAGLRGRLPAGLPGSWLRPLLPLARVGGGPP